MYLAVLMTIPEMWWTHGYRKKTVFRFIDRIVDQKNNSTVKQIFLVLDNISIHKSNKVK